MTWHPIARLRDKLNPPSASPWRRHGLNQADLAELMGVHLQTVSKWERCLSNPSPWQWDVLILLGSSPELASPGIYSIGLPCVRLSRALVAVGGGQVNQPSLNSARGALSQDLTAAADRQNQPIKVGA